MTDVGVLVQASKISPLFQQGDEMVNGWVVRTVETVPEESDDVLTFARIAQARAEWQAETDEVMGALGIMAATANDHDADIISRAMALIEMGSYD